MRGGGYVVAGWPLEDMNDERLLVACNGGPRNFGPTELKPKEGELTLRYHRVENLLRATWRR